MSKKFSNPIIISIVILNAIFAISIEYLFLKVGSEPENLIRCWFAFTTGELWFLASIKKAKVKNKEMGD